MLYALIEETREKRKVQIEDNSLLAMVRFLHNNKDCSRLRERQRWFSCMKNEKEREKEEKIQETTERTDKKEREDEQVDEEGEQEDNYDEILPMELLEHVKKALKEFQASLSNPGNNIHKILYWYLFTTKVGQAETTMPSENTDFQKRIVPWQNLGIMPQVKLLS